MIKKIILLASCIFSMATINAQTFAWANKIGSTGADLCRDIATDAAGNVYSTGTFTGSADFDPGAGTTTLTSAGGTDIFISKLDATGALVWAVRIGNASNEEANGIALDASGNIHITGCFYGTVDFDPGPGVVNSGNMTGADIYVLKLTNSGGFVWYKQFGGTNDNQLGIKIAVDAAGNVYSTGQSIGVIDFDPGPGVANLGVAFSGNTNFYVSKLDASGNYVWAKVMGNSSSSAYATDIVVSSSQEVYTCGYFIATSLDFDPGAGTVSLSTGSAYDGFVHKFTSAGLYSWVRRIGGGNTPDACNAIALDAYGVYTTGYFYGTADLDPGVGTVNHTSAGLTDIFVHKMDWGGIYLWSKQLGGTADDYGYGIDVDVAGGIYTTGFFTGAADFDPNAGTQTLTAVNLRDAFISKLNPVGFTNASYAWGFQLGGTGTETGYGIAVNILGNVYTGGYFGGTGDYDPTGGTFNMTPVGGNDIFIQKMSQCMVPVAPANTNAPASPWICYNTSITLTVSGVGTIGWYTAASGGTYLGGGSSYNTGNLTANVSYYVQDSLCAASSTRRQINVVVTPLLTSTVSSQTNIACNGGTNGAATILPSGGSPGYTYAWTPSGGTAASASGLAAGTYSCTITDALGCVYVQTVSITQPAMLSASINAQNNITCNGGTNGSVTLTPNGGTGPYTYLWSPSGGTAATATGLTATTYTCTITDANSCTGTQTVTITQPSVMTSSVSSQTNISCNGGATGSATILAGGGTPTYTYSWSPSGGTAATATGLAAATYTCTITDANSCTRTQTVTLTQPTAIASSISSQTNISCNGGSNGSATVSVSGGIGPYTYSWAPSGGIAATATGLSAATYTCTITDANLCTQAQAVTITQPSVIVTSVSSQTNISCNGGNDGAVTILVSGGASPYTYSWTPSGGTAATANGLATGIYTCTITDANSCTSAQTVSITQPSAIASSVSSQTDVTCFGNNDGTAGVTASGGTGTLTYAWTPTGGNAAAATGLSAGIYTCIITDNNSCTVQETVTLTEPPAIASSQTVTLCAGQTLTVGSNTYAVTGLYTDVLTAVNGCDSTVTSDLTVNPVIDLTTTSVTITITANQAGASYQWIDCNNGNAPLAGETNQSFTATANGNYAVIISMGPCSDTSACTFITTVGINENQNQAFNLFPNPTTDVVTIQLTQSFTIATIEVTNALGQIISTTQTNTAINTFTLPEEAGIYFIRVTVDGKFSTSKVVKQ